MLPVVAHNLLESIHILASSAKNFSDRCIQGIRPNLKRIKELAEANISVVTALAPKLGYDTAAKLAKEACETGETLRAIVLKKGLMPEAELDKALDLLSMTTVQSLNDPVPGHTHRKEASQEAG